MFVWSQLCLGGVERVGGMDKSMTNPCVHVTGREGSLFENVYSLLNTTSHILLRVVCSMNSTQPCRMCLKSTDRNLNATKHYCTRLCVTKCLTWFVGGQSSCPLQHEEDCGPPSWLRLHLGSWTLLKLQRDTEEHLVILWIIFPFSICHRISIVPHNSL